MIIGADTETALFGPGNQIPALACVSLSVDGHGSLLHHTDVDLGFVLWLLEQETTWHNASYDMAVFARHQPDAIPYIFEAYAAERVHCTKIREQLIDLAHGDLGMPKKGKYTLETLARKYLDKQLDKDTYRLTYGELRELPLSEWPQGAIDYPIDDAHSAKGVFDGQAKLLAKTEDLHLLADAPRQAAYDFAFQLLSAWGMRTDPKRVRRLKDDTRAELLRMRTELIDRGLMRVETIGKRSGNPRQKISRNLSVIREAVMDAYGDSVPTTGKGNISTSRETIERHPKLKIVSDYVALEKLNSTYIKVLDEGLNFPIHGRFHLLATGRRGADKNMQTLPKKGGVRECYRPRKGYVFGTVDYDSLEMRTWAQLTTNLFGIDNVPLAQLYRDDPNADPHTKFAAEHFMHISYEDGMALKISAAEAKIEGRSLTKDEQDLKRFRQASKACFHPDTEILTPDGWRLVADLKQGDLVAAAVPCNVHDLRIEWQPALRITQRIMPELVHLFNEGVNLRVTPDHRMLAFRTTGEPYTTTPEEMNKARTYKHAGDLLEGDDDLDDTLLRLAVATQADGSYNGPNTIRFGFTKQRKIDRFRWLTTNQSTREYTSSQGVTCFSVKGELNDLLRALLDDKKLPMWWMGLSHRLRTLVIEETRHWGHSPPGSSMSYSTTHKQNADVLQALCAVTGYKASVGVQTRSNPKHNDTYSVKIKQRSYSRGGNLRISKHTYDGKVVCLSVPSECVLVRDGGKTIITQQCNFGLPGGLGVQRFVEYAYTQYDVQFEQREAKGIVKGWKDTWNAWKYFEYVAYMENNYGWVEQEVSGRIRGGLGYCDLANTGFQGLAADGCMLSLFLCAWACYAEFEPTVLHRAKDFSPLLKPDLKPRPALYGSRIVNSLHDELVFEIPEENASAAIHEARDIMVGGMSRYCPDIPIRVSGALMTRWLKDAPCIMKNGEMQVYEVP